MTMTTTPRRELELSIQMITEAIEFCKAEGEDFSRQAEVLAEYQAKLARFGDSDGGIIRHPQAEGVKRNLTDRPQAGAPAANQYGVFTVAYATEKQTRFIGGLLEQKDLSSLANSVTLDIVRLKEQVAANQVNKKAASAIIDRLLALPDLAAPVVTAPADQVKWPASEKQVALIQKLAGEKAWHDGIETVSHRSHAGFYVREVVEGRVVSKRDASASIDFLFGCATVARQAARVEIQAGVYVNTDGSTYRVYLGQQSGKMLAAQVVDGEFEYAGMADRFVKADARKMSAEEAGAWGKTTGRCVFCARRLDVPTSVDRGIGPDCFAKFC